MKKHSKWLIFVLLLLIVVGCSNQNTDGQESTPSNQSSNTNDESELSKENQPETEVRVSEITTDLQFKEETGWWIVPEGVNKMTISATVDNADTVLFWTSPTGTNTWGERVLIGYDINGEDGWSITWEFGNKELYNHITVQALGSDFSTLDDETINVTSTEQ